MVVASNVRGSLLLLVACVCTCTASSPLLAWSNTDLLLRVTPDDLLHTYSTVNQISGALFSLDFIIVFASEKLNFDDIARYGGLYDDATDSPLAPIKGVMESAKSSVWGETTERDVLIDELSLFTFTSPQYLSWPAGQFQLKKSGSLQLLIVELYDDIWDHETALTRHGEVVHQVMSRLNDFGAKYAAFYTSASHHGDRERRFANSVPDGIFSASGKNGTNQTVRQVCNRTAILYEQSFNGSELIDTTFCSLLCIKSTDRPYLDPVTNDTLLEPLLAVYWPSWRDQMNANESGPSNYHCNMTDFEFDYDSKSCVSSSLQEEYFSERNLTSNSITAYLQGRCGVSNDTEDVTNITLKVEFIFFGGGNALKVFEGDFIKLPGNQILMPGYWTMQLMLTNVTSNDSTNTDHYLTRYQTDFSLKNDSNSSTTSNNLTLKRGLFYPFSIPYYVSYACLTHQDRLWLAHGNPNRFVPTKIPLNSSYGFEPANVTDGPVLQFVGFQVQAFGNVYGAHPNTTLLSFSSVYDCEGYFDIASWAGTFVAVILTVMLYFAALALFSTKTVDRFDDPRGRTITVENLH